MNRGIILLISFLRSQQISSSAPPHHQMSLVWTDLERESGTYVSDAEQIDTDILLESDYRLELPENAHRRTPEAVAGYRFFDRSVPGLDIPEIEPIFPSLGTQQVPHQPESCNFAKGGVFDAYYRILQNLDGSEDELIGGDAGSTLEVGLISHIRRIRSLRNIRADIIPPLMTFLNLGDITSSETLHTARLGVREAGFSIRPFPLDMWIKYCIKQSYGILSNICLHTVKIEEEGTTVNAFTMPSAIWAHLLIAEGPRRLTMAFAARRRK